MSFLDFSAAFDTVDHGLLINKLRVIYGISGTALELFKSYLENRSYRVKIGETLSDPQKLKFGVPQGSILGPILYSLYVGEIENIAERYGVKVHVYADDVVLYSSCEEMDSCKECHEQIKIWSSNNFLKLNNKKTQLICLSPRNSKTDKLTTLNLMGECITVSNAAKYLGIWIDESMTMTRQVNHACSQGYMVLKNLWKLSNKLNNIEPRRAILNIALLALN